MLKSNMARKRIRGRRGHLLTVAQYAAFAQRNEMPCKHGHLGCAAWNKGPCTDELLSEQRDVIALREHRFVRASARAEGKTTKKRIALNGISAGLR